PLNDPDFPLAMLPSSSPFLKGRPAIRFGSHLRYPKTAGGGILPLNPCSPARPGLTPWASLRGPAGLAEPAPSAGCKGAPFESPYHHARRGQRLRRPPLRFGLR